MAGNGQFNNKKRINWAMPAVKNGNLLALLRLNVFLIIYQNDQDIDLYVYYTSILM